MQRSDLTVDFLHSEFDYNNGNLFWKKNKGPIKKGTRAGRVVKDGYIQTCVAGIRLMNHQIIFMMFHGFIPTEIDHMNRDVSDNRIENLRQTTRSDNLKNRMGWKWRTKHG